ncbi:hypothetical protein O6H91_12G081800 [Diphasiastrum complanatum]|nr:hypothetical protein O6H91_12G081000 [Diphasiastrum complanatum]KAJ7536788.1 hypothetical protein O6H91_12G081800 [Diphasiastrum complanatum]
MELFQTMQREDAKPDNFTFVAILKACANLTALEEGRDAHAQIIQTGWDSDIFVGNSLVDMYAKCGSIAEAYKVFSGMPTRDVVSWNTMIMGYVKCEMPRMALELYDQMRDEKIEPDAFTFSGVLNACSGLEALEYGKLVHEQVTSMGLQFDSYVGSSLVDMYTKCGRIVDACKVFNDLPVHDVVSWSAMIIGFVNCGHGEKALELFQHMQQEGVEPNVNTFVGVLNACASMMALEEGKLVHAQIIRKGLELDVFVGSSIVDMYAKCGSIDDACRVFNNMPVRNVVSWSALLGGYAKCGQGRKALELFQHMQQDMLEPDTVTFVGVLKACASIKALEEGKLVHAQVIKNGIESNIFVRSCLVDMYIKCGCIDEAHKVFKKFRVHDVITWSAMILGFVKFGQGEKALESFQQMLQEQVEPDNITYVAVLNACASQAAFQEGRLVHAQVIRQGLDSDMFVGSSLVDMYSKCGSIVDACRVFNNMPTHNVVSWSAMIMGYAVHGLGNEAEQLFEKMCQEDVDIDAGIFVSLLSAFSHTGLVNEGSYFFESMSPMYGIQATMEHYSCMVDLLARSGCLIEAEDIIMKMPCRPDSSLWVTLLGSCRNYGNVQMGERAAEHIFRLDPGNAPGYVLLSNVYAAAGKADATTIFQETTTKTHSQIGRQSWVQLHN